MHTKFILVLFGLDNENACRRRNRDHRATTCVIRLSASEDNLSRLMEAQLILPISVGLVLRGRLVVKNVDYDVWETTIHLLAC
jgi:hypothetical protein